jgi:DNA (cytosine-5)-methyltransferase 1
VTALYNENAAYPAAWLRNLVAAGQVAPGDVDERSICDLEPDNVRDAVQFHAFAGIGGWSYALRLAGWPDDLPVWTGSCPCQSFSATGRKKGFDDDRHLWPAWFRLIEQCRPAVVFGEQVASPDALKWLDLVQADLEGAGYAVGAADLCAASVGAPHIRQRLYFVAVASGQRQQELRLQLRQRSTRSPGSEALELADTNSDRLQGHKHENAWQGTDDRRRRSTNASTTRIVGNAGSTRSRRDAGAVLSAQGESPEQRFGARCIANELVSTGSTAGFWADADWWLCRDGFARPAQPGSFPLAIGVTGRVGQLRVYGNCIVVPLATTFIRACVDAITGGHDVD